LTLVDLAGTYPSESVYLNIPEINKSTGYVRSLFKTLVSGSSAASKNSKIYKELDALINGHAKICFVGERPIPMHEERIPLMKVKKHKFNKMFIEYMVLQEIIEAE
jgi:hypothetical protein